MLKRVVKIPGINGIGEGSKTVNNVSKMKWGCGGEGVIQSHKSNRRKSSTRCAVYNFFSPLRLSGVANSVLPTALDRGGVAGWRH